MNRISIVMRERERKKEEIDKQISICQLTIRAMGKRQIKENFPGSAVVKTLLPLQGLQVWFLVGCRLRGHTESDTIDMT